MLHRICPDYTCTAAMMQGHLLGLLDYVKNHIHDYLGQYGNHDYFWVWEHDANSNIHDYSQKKNIVTENLYIFPLKNAPNVKFYFFPIQNNVGYKKVFRSFFLTALCCVSQGERASEPNSSRGGGPEGADPRWEWSGHRQDHRTLLRQPGTEAQSRSHLSHSASTF